MVGSLFQYLGGDDSASDAGLSENRRVVLFDRRRADRASVNGKVRYVLLGMLSVIGISVLTTVVF